MKRYVLLINAILLCACEGEKTETTSAKVTSTSCKGVYYVRDANGDLEKFNQYWQNDQGACLTDNMPLSQWEKTSEAWAKTNVQCTPQPQFGSRSLVSANNYYSYRDGKVYLDLNSSTGVYRRVVLGEGESGMPVFTRVQGCFYQRTGTGVDAGFGNQLLLDTNSAKLATSENFDPMEIFRYDETATAMTMTRFDDSDNGWGWTFCPFLRTPWEFCELLRDGNIMYWPTTLTNTQKNDLYVQALLIRKQYNFDAILFEEFEDLWNTVEDTGKEIGRDDWKYSVIPVVDTPWYIDAAWRDYIMGQRPTMPNVNSNRMQPLCYTGSQTVELTSGNMGRVYGQICYINGEYIFTQQ